MSTDDSAAPTRLPPFALRLIPVATSVFSPEKVRFVRFTTEATNNNGELIDGLELWTTGKDSRNAAETVDLLESYVNNPKHKLVHLNDGKYGNDYSWISNQEARDGFSSNYLSPP